MAVNLKKPEDIGSTHGERVLREITPVHICDEVYPQVNKPRCTLITPEQLCVKPAASPAIVEAVHGSKREIAEFLYNTICRVSRMYVSKYSDNRVMFDTDLFFDGIKNSKDREYNPANYAVNCITVKDEHIVFTYSSNPLSREAMVYYSTLLDSLTELLYYAEQPGTTFDSLCDWVGNNWTASQKHYYYRNLCKLFADIRAGHVDRIESVLRGEQTICYDGLFHSGELFTIHTMAFFTVVTTRLFRAVYAILMRETAFVVHPLFLFLCQNYSAGAPETFMTWSEYCDLDHRREALTAYGEEAAGILMNAPAEAPRALWCAEYYGDLWTAAGLGTSILGCIMLVTHALLVVKEAPTLSIWSAMFTNWTASTIAATSLIGASIATFAGTVFAKAVYNHLTKNRTNILLFGGLRCFLNAHRGLYYAMPKVIKNKQPRVLRKHASKVLLPAPDSLSLK